MKRTISFLLAVVLLLSLMPLGVLAQQENTAVITVEDAYADAGETTQMYVKIANNPGVAGATLSVSYDPSLVLVAAEPGEAFSALDFSGNDVAVFANPSKFSWDSENAEATADGTILKLTFRVSDAAKYNSRLGVDVSYRYGDIYNNDGDDVTLSIVNGNITVIDYMPGDLFEDDVINTKDVRLIRQLINGNCSVEVKEAAADVNADGVVNTKDTRLLRRYINGGYGVKLLPGVTKCSHNMQATPETPATCTENGNIAYWYCSRCEKYFSDEAGVTEVKLTNTVVEALGHNVVTVPGYPATKTETGLTDGKACDRDGCKYVEVEQEVIPVLTGHAIKYEVANGEDYIDKNRPIIPAEKMQYFSDTGIELPQLEVPGYRFIGWSYSQASSANIVTEIPKGATGEKKLYAHWEPIVYTVTFDTPDVSVNGTKITGETILNATEYTVDKGKDLPVPKCFGYTFVGWSDDDGFIVNRIKPGTTGHMTLRANWTSDRNKATSYQDYGEPIIIEDDVRGQFLFIYNIGRIDNVPLNEVEFIGKSEGLNYKKEVEVVDKVDEAMVEEINLMISNATTKSSGWTLAEDWNDLYSVQEETGSLQGYSDERTTTDGKTVGGKYFVSNSEGGSSHVSTESGSSSSSSSKITTEDSFGINGSYDSSTEKYCDAKLGVTNETELSAGVKVKYGPAEASAGVKNTTTVSAETSSGRKDTTSVHVDGSVSSFVGTVNTHDSSSYFNSAVSNSSNWNSTNSYESSNELFQEESVKNSIEQQLSEKISHNMSKALGGSNSSSEELSEQNRSDEEYNTRFTYSKGTQTSTTKYLEFTSKEPGYYRIMTAGTVHVFGVVGYDVATASYFTYCYNVLDDTTREIMDYSKDNMNFNDCQNSVVTFEIPYEVNEYIAGVTSQTDGIEISYDGEVTNFTPSADFLPTEQTTPEGETVIDEGFNGTVVIPQYVSKDNGDGTYSSVKVTSISSDAFKAAKEDIRIVVLPIYVTEIPDNAFEGCTNLETVVAYGVTSIGDNAFKGCTSLKKFYVDNKITHLGDNAFEDVSEVAIAAYDSAVADAAINCGAKNITLNISYIKDSYENKVIDVADTAENFTLIGNGGTYNNVEINSEAIESTMISNMVFANNVKTPLAIVSKTVTLARVTVENSPSFALILTGEDVNVKLLGTVTLNSTTENAVLSKSVVLSQSQQSTTSKMVVNGKYLVYGEVTNKNYLNVEPTAITDTQYEDYLVSCIVTFNPVGGEVAQQVKTVYKDKTYGELPIPERQYFAFDGWYTAAEGGKKITAETAVDAVVNHTLYAHWTPVTATIEFDANGGEVSTESKLVYLGEKVGELPAATRTHYIFLGWNTATDGGEKITTDSVLETAGVKKVYARWDMVSYSVKWNTGTGYTITVNRTSSPKAGAATGALNSGDPVYFGDTLQIIYKKADYYTISNHGVTSITVTGNVTASDIYATATLNPVSGWVKASALPSDAQVVEREWRYTLTTKKESRETSLAGYTQTGSYWVQSGSGSKNYATFPSGFDTSHSIYTSFAKSVPYTASETATSKRTVSNTWSGYVYWHWMYSVSYANTTTRTISHRYGSWDAYGNSGGNMYKYFFAMTSSVNCPYLDKNYCCSQNLASYNCHSILPSDKTNIGTPRMFRFDYYTSSYVDYYKMFQYQKVENLTSETSVSASDTISNVQEWVQYRAK